MVGSISTPHTHKQSVMLTLWMVLNEMDFRVVDLDSKVNLLTDLGKPNRRELVQTTHVLTTQSQSKIYGDYLFLETGKNSCQTSKFLSDGHKQRKNSLVSPKIHKQNLINWSFFIVLLGMGSNFSSQMESSHHYSWQTSKKINWHQLIRLIIWKGLEESRSKIGSLKFVDFAWLTTKVSIFWI